MADMLYFSDRQRKELVANYTPDIQPVWYGGHLLEAWHLMRDQGLFWPWYDPHPPRHHASRPTSTRR